MACARQEVKVASIVNSMTRDVITEKVTFEGTLEGGEEANKQISEQDRYPRQREQLVQRS